MLSGHKALSRSLPSDLFLLRLYNRSLVGRAHHSRQQQWVRKVCLSPSRSLPCILDYVSMMLLSSHTTHAFSAYQEALDLCPCPEDGRQPPSEGGHIAR